MVFSVVSVVPRKERPMFISGLTCLQLVTILRAIISSCQPLQTGNYAVTLGYILSMLWRHHSVLVAPSGG